jgi:hypothetical protein
MTVSDRVAIPAIMVPSFRTSMAIQNKTETNLLFRTWGGLGDQICAEPTLRYALKSFKHCDVSLTSERPELFSHLKFKKVFDEREVRPNYNNYLLFETITPPDDSNLVWQFFSHMLVNCVDFPSLCALRSQLPVKDRELFLVGTKPKFSEHFADRPVFVHAGRHWPSKTFPKDWWDDTLFELMRSGMTPILIGSDTDDNRGTVGVETRGCIDMRNKLSVMETIWLLQRAKILLTNDSAPLHMAASTDPSLEKSTGHCHIKFIATCKHPDHITHFRKGQWQYREENLGLSGVWDIISNCPNQGEKVTVDQIEEKILRSWLPTSKSVAENLKDTYAQFWKAN